MYFLPSFYLGLLSIIFISLEVCAMQNHPEFITRARNNKTQEIQELINAGTGVNTQNSENGDTLLIEAAWWGCQEAIAKLLEAGADVTIKNNLGETALDTAKNGYIKTTNPFQKEVYKAIGKMLLKPLVQNRVLRKAAIRAMMEQYPSMVGDVIHYTQSFIK